MMKEIGYTDTQIDGALVKIWSETWDKWGVDKILTFACDRVMKHEQIYTEMKQNEDGTYKYIKKSMNLPDSSIQTLKRCLDRI